MTGLTNDTTAATHGLFYMENAGGYPPEPAAAALPPVEEHQASCFGWEEERGESWSGAGASAPIVKETRPTL
jgi:hypothetical protein